MVRFESMSSVFKLLSKLGVIVDFAVKRDHQLFVHGGHRLCAGGDINDGETPMAKKHCVNLDQSRCLRRPDLDGRARRSSDADHFVLRPQ